MRTHGILFLALHLALFTTACGDDDPSTVAGAEDTSDDAGTDTVEDVAAEPDEAAEDTAAEPDAPVPDAVEEPDAPVPDTVEEPDIPVTDTVEEPDLDLTDTPTDGAGDATDADVDMESWNCDLDFYGTGDGCDCGCGLLDPDCEGGGCTEPECYVVGCGFCYDSEGAMTTCVLPDDPDAGDAGDADAGDTGPVIPEDWACAASFYGSGDGCDCGCGIADPDCDSGCISPECWIEGCDYCYAADGAFFTCDDGTTGGACLEAECVDIDTDDIPGAMNGCELGCTLSADRSACIALCVGGRLGILSDCGDCFGSISRCADNSCTFECGLLLPDWGSSMCLNCLETYCTDQFTECSGCDYPIPD